MSRRYWHSLFDSVSSTKSEAATRAARVAKSLRWRPRCGSAGTVCCRFDDESADQVGPPNMTPAAGDVDRDGLAPVERLNAAGRLDRGATGDSGPAGKPLANVVRDEDVDGSPVALPAVLLALSRDAVRDEVENSKGAGELEQNLRVGSDVEDRVSVVGGAWRRRPALGAVQVDHLPADQGPAGWEAFVHLEERVPGRGLRHRHRREDDHRSASTSSRALANSRGCWCSARSAARSSGQTASGRRSATWSTTFPRRSAASTSK